MLASAGSAVAGAAAAIPGAGAIAGAAGKAFTFAKTAKGIGMLQAGTGALGSIMDYMGASQEAKAQDALYEQNRQNALGAYRDDIVSLNTDAMIAQEQASDKRMELTGQALAEGASARVSTGEAGFEGFSAAAIQRDILMAKGTGIAAIDRNERLDSVRYQAAAKAAGETAKGRIQSVQKGRKPSLLSLGLGVATAGISGMMTTKSLTAAAKVT
jgi:hypothetical protein